MQTVKKTKLRGPVIDMREKTLFAINILVVQIYKLLTMGRKQTMELQIKLKCVNGRKIHNW